MKYNMSLNEVLEEFSAARIFAFMFYAQPGLRDMAILQQGMAIHPADSTILAEEVTEDLARAYDLNRGWFVRFVFSTTPPFQSDTDEWDDEVIEGMVSYLTEGLTELRVESKYLFTEVVESNV